jgi:hypothetical protein
MGLWSDHSETGSDRVLSPDELVRYGRHLALPEFGTAGQQRLKEARVAIVVWEDSATCRDVPAAAGVERLA